MQSEVSGVAFGDEGVLSVLGYFRGFPQASEEMLHLINDDAQVSETPNENVHIIKTLSLYF